MAIAFARSKRISRGKGESAVATAAYVIRGRLYDERTGVTHKFKDGGTLAHAAILLADGVDQRFLDTATLFNAIEGAERRKDAQVAQHIVIALDRDISPAERIEMAEGFARQVFVEKSRPVLVAIHLSPDGGNPHAHLIGGTRRLEAGGFASHKDRDTAFARVLGRAAFILQSEREKIGELWRDFQDIWFSTHGKAITVDPVGPVPQEHIGPKRFRSPNDHRIAINEQARELSAKIARDPKAVAEHLGQRPFDGRALEKFLTKYIADPEERAEVETEVKDKLRDLQLAALEKAAWSDRMASGAPRTIEDVARELSPEYAGLLKRAAELRQDAAKAAWARNKHDLDREAANYRVSERRAEMGVARRVLHEVGKRSPALAVLRDLELERWSGFLRGSEYRVDNQSIHREAFTKELDFVTRKAASALEAIRPAAETELIRRQRVARNAREALDRLRRTELRAAREKHWTLSGA
jgi:hypothetical protein